MANYYDPKQMAAVASKINEKAAEFHAASEALKQVISQLAAQWNDPVNQKFSQRYMQEGAAQAEKLESYVRSYANIMNQCSQKFGNAIKNGNSFLNSF